MKYIINDAFGIIVHSEKESIRIKLAMKTYLDHLLKNNFTNYSTYCKLVKKNLNLKTKIPIYINQKICLFQTKSLRKIEVILINYFMIKAIYNDYNKTIIIFKDDERLVIDVKITKIKRQFENVILLMNYIKSTSKL